MACIILLHITIIDFVPLHCDGRGHRFHETERRGLATLLQEPLADTASKRTYGAPIRCDWLRSTKFGCYFLVEFVREVPLLVAGFYSLAIRLCTLHLNVFHTVLWHTLCSKAHFLTGVIHVMVSQGPRRFRLSGAFLQSKRSRLWA